MDVFSSQNKESKFSFHSVFDLLGDIVQITYT